MLAFSIRRVRPIGTVVREGRDREAPPIPICAGHVRQLGGEKSLCFRVPVRFHTEEAMRIPISTAIKISRLLARRSAARLAPRNAEILLRCSGRCDEDQREVAGEFLQRLQSTS